VDSKRKNEIGDEITPKRRRKYRVKERMKEMKVDDETETMI
jgi:hypothetical protein